MRALALFYRAKALTTNESSVIVKLLNILCFISAYLLIAFLRQMRYYC